MFRIRRDNVTKDLVILTLLPIFSAVVSLMLDVNFFTSTLLFFGLPSVYLSLKETKYIKEIGIFSILWAIPAGLLMDTLAEHNKSWHVAHSIFPYRIFGFIPIEDIIWGVLLTYFVLANYKHFYDSELNPWERIKQIFTKGNNQRDKIIRFVSVELGIVFVALFLWVFFKFRVPYFYLVGCTFIIFLPILLFLRAFPRFLTRMLKLTALLAPQFLLFELVGLRLNQWQFTTKEFIGYIKIFGLSFPIEEFIFWFILIGAAIVTWFELVTDDRK